MAVFKWYNYFMKNDISIVLCGEAGQGVQTVESLLVKIFKTAGFNVFATKEYMSRVRGGSNSTSLRISSIPVSAYIERIDLLIKLGKEFTGQVENRISKDTKVFSDIKNNIAAIGLVCAAFIIEQSVAEKYIADRFKSKGEKVVADNIAALKEGYGLVDFTFDILPDPMIKDDIIVSGAEAVALGAIAGGCNFIAAYPMTPSTGVFTTLSQYEHEFGIISEQAEDEISAMNMAIGAWYAGARALVNTSGGGFDLMTEGLSLAGMIESPLVINLGQRPGPSTGLPTRTEQGDLEIALYSGHGEFPRIILAPGNLADAFALTQSAFDLAGKYQVPVFIMTDQYLVDSYYNIPAFPLNKKPKNYFIKTSSDYKRYALTQDGISPRGIPGFGDGLVCADSDEHDQDGRITENLDLRIQMQDKRLNKLNQIKKDAFPPELIGNSDYKILVVSWGSNREAIVEALKLVNRKEIAFLFFKQVYPVHDDAIKYLKKAKKTAIIENNATGQFAKIIKLAAGLDFDKRILKYNGMPFAVEEIVRELKKI